jgi:ABC-type polysaccharide/polyol phosphate transport system ATPase subunit
MLVRLAFSIATAIEPEILLVDEVLSAGDLAFQQKAQQRLKEMMARAKIIVVVSHDLGSLPRLCETGVWLAQGRVRMVGPVDEVIAAYRAETQGLPPPRAEPEPGEQPPARTGFAQPTYT